MVELRTVLDLLWLVYNTMIDSCQSLSVCMSVSVRVSNPGWLYSLYTCPSIHMSWCTRVRVSVCACSHTTDTVGSVVCSLTAPVFTDTTKTKATVTACGSWLGWEPPYIMYMYTAQRGHHAGQGTHGVTNGVLIPTVPGCGREGVSIALYIAWNHHPVYYTTLM